MKRKLLSIVLALCLTLTLLPTMSVAAGSYADTNGHWAETSIERWSSYGILQGSEGKFAPDGTLTRAQMATILSRLLNLPAAESVGFTDVPAGEWYADAINRCAAAGILQGTDGKANPNAPITREQAMVMLCRALGIEALSGADLSGYPDGAQVSPYAQGYVAALVRTGIVKGDVNGKLNSAGVITRAEIVTIVDRMVTVYANADGTAVSAANGGTVLVVAKNVKVENAPEGTKIIAGKDASGLSVNGKAVSAGQTYIVPAAAETKPSTSGNVIEVPPHAHVYTYVDNGNGTHTATCYAGDVTFTEEHSIAGNQCTLCGAAQTVDSVASVLGEDGTYTYYDSLIKALNAVANGGTVKLVTDETLDAQLAITKSVTIDLGGHTLTSTVRKDNGKDRYSLLTRAAMTIKNGTYKGTGDARGIAACAPLTLDGVTVDVAGLVSVGYSAADCTYVIKNSNIKGNYSLANFVNNAKITITDSKITGVGNVLYHNGSNYGLDLTVTDTTITGTGDDGCGVYISGSTTTLANGGLQKATFKNCTISGTNGVEVKYTDLTMEDCTVTATGDPSFKQNNNGPVTSGFAVVSTDNTMEPTAPAPAGTVSITGGKGLYTGLVGLRTFPGILTKYPDMKESTYAITGGTFDHDPSGYVADGYFALPNGDGTYTVVTANQITSGVTIQGIAGYEHSAFATVADAYSEINPKVAALGGLGQETCSKEAFDALYTDDAKITWTIYGKQALVAGSEGKDAHTFTFGRAASYYRNDCNIAAIIVKGGNDSAALDLSATGGTFALPYNWWGEDIKNCEVSFTGITFDGVKSIPSTWASQAQSTPYTFDRCIFNGSVYGYHDYNINLTIQNSTFNAPENTGYAVMLQSTTGINGTVTLDHNTFNGYTRGVNLQRPGTDFIFTNNTITSTVSKPDRAAIQLTDGKSFTVTGNTVRVNAGNAFWFHSAATNSNVTYTISNNNIQAPYIGYYATSFDVNPKITSSGNIFNSTDTTLCMKKEATEATATNLTAIK